MRAARVGEQVGLTKNRSKRTLTMKLVQVGSLDPWIAMFAYRAIALVIGNHQNDVGLASKRQIFGRQREAE